MPDVGTMVACRHCGASVPPGAVRCARCGAAPAEGDTAQHVYEADPPSHAPEVPEALGERFTMETELGAGGMGVVMLARDVRLDRRVAIKLIREPSANLAARFESEARLMAGLEHENLVRVYDFGLGAGVPYLVMEYVRGHTLAHRLSAGRPTLVEAVRITLDMLAGVGAAHARGIVHRDLKPANVFLTTAGRAKVADFGLALRVRHEPGTVDRERLTGEGQVMGTPGYIAPEAIRGGEAAPAADVYAIGVMLHEMLTGHRLYVGENVLDILNEQVRGGAPDPSRANPIVPPALDELVRRAMAIDPAARIPAAELAAALAAWLDRGATRPAGDLPPAPYKLLEHYTRADAPIFFGRDAEAAELVELVEHAQSRVVFVFGPCGIGKSSLLNAGLLPRLDATRLSAQLLFAGSDPARVLRELVAAEAVQHGIALPGGEAVGPALLEKKPRLVNDLLLMLHRVTNKTAVYVIDQLEELFTRNARDSKRIGTFFDLVTRIAESPALPVRLVLSYRTEFRGDFFPLEERVARLQRSFQVREMGAEGLREAITGPARHESYGLRYDEGVPERITADILAVTQEGRDAAPPLLQIICSQLYERRAARITADLYLSAVGGAKGALRRYVEERLAGPAYARRGAIARQMLKALTQKEEGGERFSRPLEEEEVVAFPDRAGARQTLERLAADHLVVREAGEGGKRTVRLASEVICALVETWALEPDDTERASRLLDWAHRQWRERGRRPEDLLSGGLLHFVEQHVDAIKGLGEGERAYVAEAARRRDRRFGVLALQFSGLAFAVIIFTFAVVSNKLTAYALDHEQRNFRAAQSVPAQAVDVELRRLRDEAITFASEPRVIAALDTDPGTFGDSVRHYRVATRSDFFLVTDANGQVLFHYPERGVRFATLADLPPELRDIRRPERQLVMIDGGNAYLVVRVQIEQGVRAAGRITLGYAISPALATQVKQSSNADAVLTVDGTVVVSTTPEFAPGDALAAPEGPPTRVKSASGHEFLQSSEALRDTGGRARWILLRSLEPYFEMIAAVRHVMIYIGLCGVALALLASWRLTRTAARWT